MRKSENSEERMAQGRQNFITDHPVKKRLMKVHKETNSMHYIDIYDITGVFNRQLGHQKTLGFNSNQVGGGS
jgi:hypothetical protein